jgi:hypothetical protein
MVSFLRATIYSLSRVFLAYSVAYSFGYSSLCVNFVNRSPNRTVCLKEMAKPYTSDWGR